MAFPPDPDVVGLDFVACTACGSEIDVSDSEGSGWRDIDDPTWITLRCDWEPCGQSFEALLLPKVAP